MVPHTDLQIDQKKKSNRDLYIQKEVLIFFSLSYLHFFSSAGQQVVRLDNQFKVMCVVPHPSSPEVFLCGGYSSTVKAWDSRSSKVKLINLLRDDLSFLLTLLLQLLFDLL